MITWPPRRKLPRRLQRKLQKRLLRKLPRRRSSSSVSPWGWYLSLEEVRISWLPFLRQTSSCWGWGITGLGWVGLSGVSITPFRQVVIYSGQSLAGYEEPGPTARYLCCLSVIEGPIFVFRLQYVCIRWIYLSSIFNPIYSLRALDSFPHHFESYMQS